MGPLGGVDWHAELVRGDLAQPVLAGPGPTLLSGLRERIELELELVLLKERKLCSAWCGMAVLSDSHLVCCYFPGGK